MRPFTKAGILASSWRWLEPMYPPCRKAPRGSNFHSHSFVLKMQALNICVNVLLEYDSGHLEIVKVIRVNSPMYTNAKPCDSTAWASLRLPPHCITVNTFSHIASTIVSFGNKLNTLIPIVHFQCQDMGLIIEAMVSFMPRRVCGAEVTIYLASLSGILSTTAPPVFKLFKCLICQKMPWTP